MVHGFLAKLHSFGPIIISFYGIQIFIFFLWHYSLYLGFVLLFSEVS
jgi:hypothetical protein